MLDKLFRRILDHIHQGGNIFYDRDRMQAYTLIAVIASNWRKDGRQ